MEQWHQRLRPVRISVSNGADARSFLNNVLDGHRYDGTFPECTQPSGDCEFWTNADRWPRKLREHFKLMALNSMDVVRNGFFWTWKIGKSEALGRVAAPAVRGTCSGR